MVRRGQQSAFDARQLIELSAAGGGGGANKRIKIRSSTSVSSGGIKARLGNDASRVGGSTIGARRPVRISLQTARGSIAKPPLRILRKPQDARELLLPKQRRPGAGRLTLTTTALSPKRLVGARRVKPTAAKPKTLPNFTIQADASPEVPSGVNVVNAIGERSKLQMRKTIQNARINLSQSGTQISKTFVTEVRAKPTPLIATASSSRSSGGLVAVGNPTMIRKTIVVNPDAMDTSTSTSSHSQQDNKPTANVGVSSISNRLSPTTSSVTQIIITNLAPSVTAADVQELCNSVSNLEHCQLVDTGVAMAVYKLRADAEKFHANYNDRELDGVPMHVKVLGAPPPSSSSTQQQVATTSANGADMSLPALRLKLKKKPPDDPAESINLPSDAVASALHGVKIRDASNVTFTVKI